MALGRARSNTNAVIALGLGIVSFLGLGLLTGIPAWVLGRQELKRIDAGEGAPESRTMAQIGMVLGIIATLLSVAAIVLWLFFVGGVMAIGHPVLAPRAPVIR